jgi:WD40 repeat protein
MKLFNIILGHKGKITYLKFSPDGLYLLSCSEDQTFKLWRKEDSFLLKSFAQELTGISFSPDGRSLAIRNNKGLFDLIDLNFIYNQSLTV